MDVDDVVAQARARARRRAPPASAWARPGAARRTATSSRSPTMVEGVARARARDLRDARHADARAGAAAERGRARLLQPQPRHVAGASTARSSPRAPTRTASTRSRAVREAGIHVCCGGILGMGETRRATASPSCTRSRRSTRTRRACRSTTSCRSRARRSRHASARPDRVRAHRRARAHPDAALARAALRGPHRHERRDAGAVLPRRGELHLLRREAPDHRQPRHGERPRPAVSPGDAAPSPRPPGTADFMAALPVAFEAALADLDSRGPAPPAAQRPATRARHGRDRARRQALRRLLQQRLPRPCRAPARDGGLHRGGARTRRRRARLAPDHRPPGRSTRRSRRRSPHSRAASARCSSPPATWPTSASRPRS